MQPTVKYQSANGLAGVNKSFKVIDEHSGDIRERVTVIFHLKYAYYHQIQSKLLSK